MWRKGAKRSRASLTTPLMQALTGDALSLRVATLTSLFDAMLGAFSGPDGAFYPPYLLAALAIAWIAGGGRIDWRAARAAALHPSQRTDLKLFVLGRITALVEAPLLVLAATIAGALVAGTLRAATGIDNAGMAWTFGRAATLTLAFILVADFCTYWVHRWHHKNPVLWPFHAVHHSAETLSPLTLERKHPLYDLFSAIVKGTAGGALQGALFFAFVGDNAALTIGGANAIYVLFALAGAHLRHTHVWVSFGPILGRVFVSPAMHQIHHSAAPQHHDRNYGEIFALWDWGFATLYLPRARETLRFGLSDGAGGVVQPHPSLRAALVTPFVESAKALSQRRRGTRARVLEPAS